MQDVLSFFVFRSLMQGLDLMDSGVFDLSDWDQRLPPPAAKAAVQTLPVVIISPEQAGVAVWVDVCEYVACWQRPPG